FLGFFFFIIQISFAQSSNNIEKKLSEAFFKIHYFRFYNSSESSSDSLEKANGQFEELLLTETSKKPQTLYSKFKSLKDSGLCISTSADGNFRIYCWDTWTGG